MEVEVEKKRPGSAAAGAARRASPSATRASSMDRPGFRTLEKKNKQLNNATKQLEEKVKNLAQKSAANKNRSLPKVSSNAKVYNSNFHPNSKHLFFSCRGGKKKDIGIY